MEDVKFCYFCDKKLSQLNVHIKLYDEHYFLHKSCYKTEYKKLHDKTPDITFKIIKKNNIIDDNYKL
jgi:hypothetical protein